MNSASAPGRPEAVRCLSGQSFRKWGNNPAASKWEWSSQEFFLQFDCTKSGPFRVLELDQGVFLFSHSRISVSVSLGCLHIWRLLINYTWLSYWVMQACVCVCMYDTKICHIPAFKLDPSIAKLRRLLWSKMDCGAFCGSKVNQRTLVMLHSVAIFGTLKSEIFVPLH